MWLPLSKCRYRFGFGLKHWKTTTSKNTSTEGIFKSLRKAKIFQVQDFEVQNSKEKKCCWKSLLLNWQKLLECKKQIQNWFFCNKWGVCRWIRVKTDSTGTRVRNRTSELIWNWISTENVKTIIQSKKDSNTKCNESRLCKANLKRPMHEILHYFNKKPGLMQITLCTNSLNQRIEEY